MICVATGKIKHSSRGEAIIDLRSIRAKNKRNGVEYDVYKCKKCGSFHIGRKYAKIKKQRRK